MTKPAAKSSPKAGRTTKQSTETDRKALALRREGRSFGTIGRTLGLPGVREAVEAFNRGLRLEPKRMQQSIRREERARLDELWRKTEQRELSPADLERRRRGVDWHRAQLEAK